MRAVLCERYGDLDGLELRELPDPAPGEGQLCIEVRAAALNFTDCLLVRDRYQVSAGLPFVPGSEIAGVVREVGPGVAEWQPGDNVFGMAFVGGFADRIVMPAQALKRVPEGVDFGEAAAFFVAFSTAYGALVHAGEVKSGDTVVVLGAAGGVGLAAVQIARHLGATVIAAASSAAKLEVCLEEGARHGIDYAREPLKERIKELSGGGADVVIDPVGGDFSEASFRAMAVGGRFVVVGFASGSIGSIPLNLPLLKGAQVRAFDIAKVAAYDSGGLRGMEAVLLAKLAGGELRPRISARFPLERAGEALRAMEERRAIGKIVVEP